MQSSSQGRYGYPGYQGYPYVNPVVHDVPSVDAATASRWANLPRRPAHDGPSVVVSPGSSSGGSQTGQSSSQDRQGYASYRGYPYVNPVYNDVSGSTSPGTSGPSSLSGNSSQAAQRPQTSSNNDTVPPKRDIDENPVVYIDIPEAGSEVSRSIETRDNDEREFVQVNTSRQTPSASRNNNDTVPPKRDIDENPVVYIDMPEAGSEVSRSIEISDDDEPEFVQNTIMYDPFENRRIDMPKDDEMSAGSSESGSTSAYTPQYPRPIPMRPNTLNLAGASGSSTQSPASSSRQTPGLPGFMSKESQVYGGSDGADGFPLSPIPISEFPEPPPAYTEVAESPPARDPVRVVETPQPPRTQVIVNEAGSQMNSVPVGSPMSPVPIGTPMSPVPIGTPMSPVPIDGPMHVRPTSVQSMNIIGRQNIDQKYLICHHCGARVHTIVQKEMGAMTHFMACMFFFLFMPFIVVVYFSDYFKYKNHYCPSCFKLIGYETPVIGQKVNYVT